MEWMDHFKGFVITLILFIGFGGCLLPLRIAAKKELMSYATCFSGGVILSVAFCHLLPDATSDLAKVTEFPLANFLCCVGFFLVMYVEKVSSPHEAILSEINAMHNCNKEEIDDHDDNDMCLGASMKCLSNPGTPLTSTLFHPEENGGHAWESAPSLQASCTLRETHHHHVKYTSKAFREGLEGGLKFVKHMTNEGLDGLDMSFKENKTNEWVPFTLLLIMSFHSVVEGLALGSATKSSEVFMMAVAILSHKFLAAVSLGISFVTAQVPSTRHVTFSCFFSLMTPFGAALGVFISLLLDAGFVSIFAAVCQAIGSGTFLYISLMELLLDEISGAHVKRKMAVAVLGFLLMAAVAVYI
eukprot:TRINITY_DN7539_c0_g2_i1.p1 TRINITY_DN7539_c0_g2~~TRINITY_DN7539_c0_g2_i1.p1  ORF type:complete len:382 (+),score=65.43 TRINITY_DN7539_c0_g2_i1:77-1147(+)